LEEEEDLFKRVVETTNEGILIVDENFVITFANQRMQEMLGYSLEEMLGHPAEELVWESEISDYRQRMERRKQGSRERHERTFKKKDGSPLPALVSATPILKNGEFRGSFAMISDISRIKQVEDDLSRALEELKTLEFILKSSPAVAFIWKLGLEGPVQFVTENISQWGYAKEEFESGKLNFQDIVHPDDRERVIAEILRLTEEGRGEFRQFYRILTKDGRTRWVDDCTLVRRDPSGKVIGYQGIVLDVTERKIAEKEAEEARLRLQSFLEASPDLIYLKDLSGKNLLVNSAYAHYFGKDKSEIEGKNDREIMPPSLAEQCALSDREVLQANAPIRVEETIQNEKGLRAFDTIKFPIPETDGKIVGIGGISRDITEKKKAEEKILESERNVRGFLEALKEPALLLDSEGKILFANSNALLRLGIPPPEMGERNLFDFLNKDLAQRLSQPLQKVMEGGEALSDEVEMGDRSFLLQVYPWKTEEGRVERLVLLMIDITERKRLEEEREKVKNALIYSVSHDLKTPLMVMEASLDLISLSDPGKREEKFREYDPLFRNNLNRLKRRVENLLLSQKALLSEIKPSVQKVEVTRMFQEIISDMKTLAQFQGVELEEKVLQGPRFWDLDAELISRALENVISNAIKFSPKGGRVTVSLESLDDQLRFIVEDRGQGITPEEQKELFQPFKRLTSAEKSNIPGTGLGLFVSRKLVEAQGGTLSLESAPGKGTKVTITIPRIKSLS
jgi:PAS domain S-box-containing protein